MNSSRFQWQSVCDKVIGTALFWWRLRVVDFLAELLASISGEIGKSPRQTFSKKNVVVARKSLVGFVADSLRNVYLPRFDRDDRCVSMIEVGLCNRQARALSKWRGEQWDTSYIETRQKWYI